MAKKQRILFVITKSNFGGAQRYLFDLATHLKETFDVAVALGGVGGRGDSKGALAHMLAEAGIKTYFISHFMYPISFSHEFLALKELADIMRDTKPDIVHLNSSKAGGIGAIAARLREVPKVIYTVHGWPFNEKTSRLIKWFRVLASLATGWFATHIITISKSDSEIGRSLPFLSKKITLIQNGIDPRIPFLTRDEARGIILEHLPSHVPREDVPWIGTISELVPNKGIPVFIEACKQLRDEGASFSTIIIGEGPERKKLEELIASHGLDEMVFLTGFVPQAQTILSAFDMFALTSHKEGLPYVILEAGLASLPVVASDVGGIPDIIESRKNGLLVQADRPMETARALRFLIAEPEKRTRFGENLKKQVLSSFTLEKMVHTTMRLYREKSV